MLGRRADGFHELESLVVFADVARPLTLDARRAARARSARPDRAAQAGALDDNLVLKAARALAARGRRT